MRICVLSERLAPPFDEGIKNCALHLALALRVQHEVLLLTTFGQSEPALGIENLPSNPLMLSPALAARIGRFRPDLILYIPTACATLFSFWRSRMLKRYGRGAPVALVALQARIYGWAARALMPCLRPERVLIQSEATRAALERLGCCVQRLSPGIDLERFYPATATQKAALRRRYGFRVEDYIVAHVGHLNRGRNVQALLPLQRLGVQVVVVGSTSTTHDDALVAELEQAGVRVIREFMPKIAEIYQLADCYVFPVRAEQSSIDLPLSVLEALACDLPVVTTRFGGLPLLFNAGPGFYYFDAAEPHGTQALVECVEACRVQYRGGTRVRVVPYAWPRVAEQMLAELAQALSLPASCPSGSSSTEEVSLPMIGQRES